MRSFDDTISDIKIFASQYNTKEFKVMLAKEKLLYGVDLSDSLKTTSYRFKLKTQDMLSLNCIFPSLKFSDCIMTLQYPCVAWLIERPNLTFNFKNLYEGTKEPDTYEELLDIISRLEYNLKKTEPRCKYGDLNIYTCDFLTSTTSMHFKRQDLIGTVEDEIVFIIGMPLCRTASISSFELNESRDKIIVTLIKSCFEFNESSDKSMITLTEKEVLSERSFKINISDYSLELS